MSEDEGENLCFYGTPLEPYDEDAFPKRKPVTVEDQIATDAQGRRRFHGAFTGGFSAGFYNTVGSLEGWTPTEFKSSRQEKANNIIQQPSDFMDDEDIGEYGIAPQKIRATKDYSTIKKRPRQAFPEGPIPGEPVLETLLTSGNETVGYLLLRNMGIEDKIKKRAEEVGKKVYGCEMPTQHEISDDIKNEEHQIPEIYKQFLDCPLLNTAGLGYAGLEKPHINLFQNPTFTVRDKNNKKISIGGQAFGVGAFEDNDEDIYAKEDMSNYDFELTKEKELGKKKQEANKLVFGMYKPTKISLMAKKLYPPPNIPQSFTGIYKVKKSRFQPLEDEIVPRNQINPSLRAKYLGEDSTETYTSSKPILSQNRLETKEESRFKDEESPKTDSLLSDRFVSASQKEDVGNILEPVKKIETTHGTPQMRDAAKMKMFGPLTRITTDWQPCALLCKRFNVPVPLSENSNDQKKKRTKNLIFEYQKHTDEESTLKPGISLDSELSQDAEEKKEDLDLPQIKTEEIEESLPSTSKEISTQSDSIEDVDEEVDTRPVDITEKIGVEEKIDLYKAVFLDSSEDENEAETNIEEIKIETKVDDFKTLVLSDDLIPKIKPLREGILSNVNFMSFNKNKNLSEECTIQESEPSLSPQVPVDPMSYGPQLPMKKDVNKPSTTETKTSVSSDSNDEWVEKDKYLKKKNKHKKNKKEKHKKHKHKKHKH